MLNPKRLLFSLARQSRLFFVTVGLFTIHFSPAQTWQPVGGGVYGGDTVYRSSVSSLCVYNNNLYVGGSFQYAGKLEANHIASWNGIRWDTLSCGTNDDIEALYVYKEMLCTGGVFDRAGRTDVNYLAYWVDGTNSAKGWQQIGDVSKPAVHRTEPYLKLILGFTEWQGWLYILANQPDYSNNFKTILKWNKGESVLPLPKTKTEEQLKPHIAEDDISEAPNGSSIPGYIKGCPISIGTYSGKLCIAGFCPYKNINNKKVFTAVSEWEGSMMELLGKDTLKQTGLVDCMYIHDSDLFVGCGYSSKYNTSGVMKWNGSSWQSVGKMVGEGNIFCMVMYKGKLYVGGGFDSICGKPANNIACWDGETWESVGEGFTTTQQNHKALVQALCVYKAELYAAGSFKYSGGKAMLNIAKLNLNGAVDKKKK